MRYCRWLYCLHAAVTNAASVASLGAMEAADAMSCFGFWFCFASAAKDAKKNIMAVAANERKKSGWFYHPVFVSVVLFKTIAGVCFVSITV